MTREKQRHRVASHDAPNGARRFRSTDLRRDPRVRADLAWRDLSGCAEHRLLKRREVADIDNRIINRPGAEKTIEGAHQPRRRLTADDLAMQTALGTRQDSGLRVARIEADVRNAIRLKTDVKAADRCRDRREHDRRIDLSFKSRDVLDDFLREVA